MAVTLTQAELAAALRLGSSAEEVAESTRLLAYATEAVSKHTPEAPTVVSNESAIRLAGYVYDQPFAGVGDRYANALRNSGAARMLLPYRVHRAGAATEIQPEEVELTDTLIQVAGFTATATAQDISASYTSGRYRAQVRDARNAIGVLYARSASAPNSDNDYFRAYGNQFFDFEVGGVPVWVKSASGQDTPLAVARYAS